MTMPSTIRPMPSSALSAVERRIESFKLGAGVGSGELPVDFSLLSVALLLPRSDFGREQFLAVDPTVQALAGEDAQLRLGHVEPTSVFGRVMNFEPGSEPASRFR